jgi:hypothetical protein
MILGLSAIVALIASPPPARSFEPGLARPNLRHETEAKAPATMRIRYDARRNAFEVSITNQTDHDVGLSCWFGYFHIRVSDKSGRLLSDDNGYMRGGCVIAPSEGNWVVLEPRSTITFERHAYGSDGRQLVPVKGQTLSAMCAYQHPSAEQGAPGWVKSNARHILTELGSPRIAVRVTADTSRATKSKRFQ